MDFPHLWCLNYKLPPFQLYRNNTFQYRRQKVWKIIIAGVLLKNFTTVQLRIDNIEMSSDDWQKRWWGLSPLLWPLCPLQNIVLGMKNTVHSGKTPSNNFVLKTFFIFYIYHAEGLVNPKVRALKKGYWFRIPQSMYIQKTSNFK
jgi:hypothetical protein